MHSEFTISADTLYGFLLVLTRVAATFVFVPMPQLRNSSTVARITLSLAVTVALQSVWPSVEVSLNGGLSELWRLLERMAAEAGFGVAVGLVVALLTEALTLAMQILGIHAGYGYASTIDPNTEADSGVLVVLAQLAAWLLFLAFGLERHVIRALAVSFEKHPAGSFAVTPAAAEAVVSLGTAVIAAALRLAMPVVGMLLLLDIAFALFGRLQAQLQLHSLAFPAKMLATLGMLAALCRAFPSVYERVAEQGVVALRRLAGG